MGSSYCQPPQRANRWKFSNTPEFLEDQVNSQGLGQNIVSWSIDVKRGSEKIV
jgi:hypothetical protein